jgi:ribonuclease HI
MSAPNAFQAMTNTANKKTNSGYSVIKGPDTVEESTCYLLQFDGLSEPNPGTSTGGAVMFCPDSRKVVFERGEFMDFATNNQAEYTGLLIGVKSALEFDVKHLLIEGDSQLVIFQTEGKWKVKNDGLKTLNKEVRDLLTRFDFVAIRHVYRDKNAHADRITNNVLKSGKSFFKCYRLE